MKLHAINIKSYCVFLQKRIVYLMSMETQIFFFNILIK